MAKFYIVTPSYNSLEWLKGCVQSVADQVCEGVEVHHHIQDGASKDGTVEWLLEWQQQHAGTSGYQLTFESAPDAGLYDAINLAWKKLPSDAAVTAHINADEQYLPNVFATIAGEMQKAPDADLVLTAHVVVDKDLRYICHRRPTFPNRIVSRGIIQIITNTCFYKASSFRARNIYFDCSYRSLGDLIFFRDTLLSTPHPRILRLPDLFGSIFVVTGDNVSWTGISNDERKRIRGALPFWNRMLVIVLCKLLALLGLVIDFFKRSPKEYSVYVKGSSQRKVNIIKYPTHRWKMRTVGR